LFERLLGERRLFATEIKSYHDCRLRVDKAGAVR
jgi:hypothetical protein